MRDYLSHLAAILETPTGVTNMVYTTKKMKALGR